MNRNYKTCFKTRFLEKFSVISVSAYSSFMLF